MIKYKVGSLASPVHLMPGDQFHLTLTEGDVNTILHVEDITEDKWYTHYAVVNFGVGVGMLVGTSELKDFVEDQWPGCECPDGEPVL